MSARSTESYQKGLKKKFHSKSRSKAFQVCYLYAFIAWCQILKLFSNIPYYNTYNNIV